MSAYAAAVSLMHILDLIKNHPSPPISLDRQQLHSLTENVTFLQEFLENYVSPFSYSDEADPLEIRIADVVYAAEDVIESYIVDSIHLAAATTLEDDDDVMESYIMDNVQLAAAAAHREDEQIRYFNSYEGLQKVIEAMDMMKKEAMEMVRENGVLLEAELQRNVSAHDGFKSKSSSVERKSEMVGFDEVRLELLDRLTGGDSNRHIIPITGMGGIGKTTLARNVFADQLIKEHFDICVWVTISQDYNIQETLREVLSQAKGSSSGARLGEELHKCLFGKRYLIVMDDMWSIDAWDKIRNFFPDCNKGSRIIVTTRMSNLAAHLTNSSNSLCMSFLNEVDSWTLFSKIVFGSEGNVSDLQLELRGIGKKIVAKCKGLPLSIIVIGGLLAKSERTKGYWKYIEGNLSSTVNLENEEYCLRVLKLSYNHLPAYLKPCFLYMGIYDEDSDIEVSTITNLWVSEGFLKPINYKRLETVAREYFQELVDRNLIIANELASPIRWNLMDRELGSVSMTKLCRMHDVRDLSLREAKKQRFYHVHSRLHNPPSEDTSSHLRRIVIPDNTGKSYDLECSPHPRSYVCHDPYVLKFPNFRLLRTLTLDTTYRGFYSSTLKCTQKDVFGLVNARLLAFSVEQERGSNVLCSSISRLWSLHTLLVYSDVDLEGPVEFWNMHQLKHVEFTHGKLRLELPPPSIGDNILILENMHSLIGMVDFHLNEDVVTRIPNLRILDVLYRGDDLNREVHCLSYLQRLSKLESFRCSIREGSRENRQRICFPPSLKQILLLYNYHPLIELDDVLQKIGRLPFVEELSIENGFFRRREWETIQGQFPRLKTLELIGCVDLEKWTVSEASHFPILERLILQNLKELEEIPSEIGEVATLKSVEVRYCSKSVVLSAKEIVEEQEHLYGEEELSCRVLVEDYHDEVLRSLASPNFQVKLN